MTVAVSKELSFTLATFMSGRGKIHKTTALSKMLQWLFSKQAHILESREKDCFCRLNYTLHTGTAEWLSTEVTFKL